MTEFAWDGNPPDPVGVPLALEGRCVAEALPQMSQTGVSLVTWYTLRDQPLRTSAHQSGAVRAAGLVPWSRRFIPTDSGSSRP